MAQTQPYVSPRLNVQVADTLWLERKAFGAKVRSARAVLGLSQDELAALVGLTQRSIHRIEQGLVEPRLRTMSERSGGALPNHSRAFAAGIAVSIVS